MITRLLFVLLRNPRSDRLRVRWCVCMCVRVCVCVCEYTRTLAMPKATLCPALQPQIKLPACEMREVRVCVSSHVCISDA